jgi:sugar lactone lactonase YvrE
VAAELEMTLQRMLMIYKFSETQFELGEGPCWSADRQSLYWVDIFGKAICRKALYGSETASWPVPERVGCVVEWRDARLLVALASGIYVLDLAFGTLKLLVNPEPERPANRLNDGKCDPAGRLWVGSTRDDEDGFFAALHRLDKDGTIHRMVDRVGCSNGLGWSPDSRTMYFTDTSLSRIDAFDFDLETGSIENRRVFVEDSESAGIPDGLAVDADGGVWSARWDGGCIVRYDSEGLIERVVKLPVRRPTSCAFGGEHLDRLFVTSVTYGISEGERTPETGHVLSLDPQVVGLPTYRFAGDFQVAP